MHWLLKIMGLFTIVTLLMFLPGCEEGEFWEPPLIEQGDGVDSEAEDTDTEDTDTEDDGKEIDLSDL